MCCEIVGVVGFLISTCVMRPSVFCSMKLLLFGGPFLAVLFEETAAAAPYELFVVVFDDDDDDGVGDIVVPVVLCGVLFCCSRDELFIGLEFNDGSKSWFRLVSSSAATILQNVLQKKHDQILCARTLTLTHTQRIKKDSCGIANLSLSVCV
jgi:hypothetical protein